MDALHKARHVGRDDAFYVQKLDAIALFVTRGVLAFIYAYTYAILFCTAKPSSQAIAKIIGIFMIIDT